MRDTTDNKKASTLAEKSKSAMVSMAIWQNVIIKWNTWLELVRCDDKIEGISI